MDKVDKGLYEVHPLLEKCLNLSFPRRRSWNNYSNASDLLRNRKEMRRKGGWVDVIQEGNGSP